MFIIMIVHLTHLTSHVVFHKVAFYVETYLYCISMIWWMYPRYLNLLLFADDNNLFCSNRDIANLSSMVCHKLRKLKT